MALLATACRPGPSAPITAASRSGPGCPRAATAGGRSLELVESVPLETRWDQPQLRETATVWREMFRRARCTIELGQFYLANRRGSALEPLLAELIAAARRGVAVRILLDKSFAKISRLTLALLAGERGIEVALWDIKALTGGVLHAKYIIVDRRELFIGSANFDWRALEHVHELGLRVVDAGLARTLARIFAADWGRATGATPARTPAPDAARIDPALYLIASPPRLNPPGVIAAGPRLIALIDRARKSLVLQVLTYATKTYGGGQWHALDRAVRRAAARGVVVRINLSDWSTQPKHLAALRELARLANVSIKLNTIPPFSGGFIPYARVDHSKYMVVDGERAWLGTSNWSGDYFTASRNVGLVIADPTIVGQLARTFELGWSGPYAHPFDVERDYRPPRVE